MKKKIILTITFVFLFSYLINAEVWISGSFGHVLSLSSTFTDTTTKDYDFYTMSQENKIGFNIGGSLIFHFSKNGYLNINGGLFPITEKYKKTVELMGKEYSSSQFNSFNNYYLRIFPEYRKAHKYGIYTGFGFNFLRKENTVFKVNNLNSSIHSGFKYYVKGAENLNFSLGMDAGYYFFYNNFFAITFTLNIERKIGF